MIASRRPLAILAFEPFDSGSHRAVRESITRHSRHSWTWLTRPGRAWKWRMRLAAVELADVARAEGVASREWDAVFATSLMSLADLIALLPRRLRALPTLLYMHENQAAYPAGVTDDVARARDVHFALTNLTSALGADAVLWNSAWNRRSFLDGLGAILRHAPDAPPGDLAARIDRRSVVAWPPVEPIDADGDREQGGSGTGRRCVRVAWPHRWEHDKGPEELLAIMEEHSEPLDLRWTILGARFRTAPPAFATIRERFADRIDHMGFVPDRGAYLAHLSRCDWVLSTARHEYFGIAVVEALLAGCLPWLPDRLSYPELLPAGARGLSPARPPADPDAIRALVRAHLAPALAPRAVAHLDDVIERVLHNRPPD